MMVSTIFTSGNTVTLIFTYTAEDGTPAAPDEAPTVTLYESDEQTVIGTPGVAEPVSLGVYSYNQTLPAATGTQTYYARAVTTRTPVDVAWPIVGAVRIVAEFATQ